MKEIRLGQTCLKTVKSSEMRKLEAQALSEDGDARCVGLLNALLDQARKIKRRPFPDVIREVNENFGRERLRVLHHEMDDKDRGRQRISFSPVSIDRRRFVI